MTKRILLIDDLRDFRDNRSCVVARTSQAALDILERGDSFDEIWLDHDLGKLPDGTLDTIMRVVDFFAERGFFENHYPVETIYVHTSNPVGSQQMIASLQNYGYEVRRVKAPEFFITES